MVKKIFFALCIILSSSILARREYIDEFSTRKTLEQIASTCNIDDLRAMGDIKISPSLYQILLAEAQKKQKQVDTISPIYAGINILPDCNTFINYLKKLQSKNNK